GERADGEGRAPGTARASRWENAGGARERARERRAGTPRERAFSEGEVRGADVQSRRRLNVHGRYRPRRASNSAIRFAPGYGGSNPFTTPHRMRLKSSSSDSPSRSSRRRRDSRAPRVAAGLRSSNEMLGVR